MIRRHQSFLLRLVNGSAAGKLQPQSARRLLVLSILAFLPLLAPRMLLAWNMENERGRE
jgi:hypothetical protein